MKIKKILFFIAVIISLLLVIIFYFGSISEKVFPDNYSSVILDEKGEMLRVFLNRDEQWCFPPDSAVIIPQKLKTAVLHFEDKRFFSHHGIDFLSLSRAIAQNIKSGRIVSGASTVTMQTARLSHPKSRTLFHKFTEMCQAINIELQYSKDDILKLYLDHAPYGGNIIGYRAASYRYFGKRADFLTWSEAALLAVLPNSPSMINPISNKDALEEKRNRLLAGLKDSGIIDSTSYSLALLEKVPNRQIPFPFIAPQLTRKLHKNYSGKEVKTTIAKKIQKDVDRICKNYSVVLKNQDINNLSVLVADTKTGEVKAYVASSNYEDLQNGGRVDGVTAPRSTGSVLKPFLYALAMDEGLISPKSLVEDVPVFYGAFSPSNADGKFSGIVTAENALIRSLNIPAVDLLSKYGIEEFYNFLQESGMSTLFRKADGYGLSLILGGAEGTLWDLAALYRGLGCYGNFDGLKLIKDEGSSKSSKNPLISRGASYLTLEMLKNVKRPGIEYYWGNFDGNLPLAWKTGTSYGGRDGWAIGVSPRWTIAVWTGNFNGKGNANIGGAKTAGPLLFDIYNYLPGKENSSLSWFKEPVNAFKYEEICSFSGYRATEDCQKTVMLQVPKDVDVLKSCPFHHPLYTTKNGKKAVCSLCWDVDDLKKESKIFLPAKVLKYLPLDLKNKYSIPPHKSDCPGLAAGSPLAITYPVPGSRIVIPKNLAGDFQKLKITAAVSRKNTKLYWYLNGKFEGETVEDHYISRQLKSGSYKVLIVDDEGHREQLSFLVDRKEK